MDRGRDKYVVNGVWWTGPRRIYATTGGLVPDSNWPGVGSVAAGAASSVWAALFLRPMRRAERTDDTMLPLNDSLFWCAGASVVLAVVRRPARSGARPERNQADAKLVGIFMRVLLRGSKLELGCAVASASWLGRGLGV